MATLLDGQKSAEQQGQHGGIVEILVHPQSELTSVALDSHGVPVPIISLLGCQVGGEQVVIRKY